MWKNRPEWKDPSLETTPRNPVVRVWRLRLSDLGDRPMAALRPLTTAAEQARADRYRFEADRQRHLAGRGLVRAALARRYDCRPRDLSFEEGPNGKPHLQRDRDDGPPLTFNIAHAGDVVLAAVSRTHPVGVDVESLDRDVDAEALARRVLTESERQRWRTLPPSQRSSFFMLVWTCKEAFLKAVGHGLQRPPTTVTCVFDGDAVVGLVNADGGDESSHEPSPADWTLRAFSVGDRVVGAVVRKGTLPSSLACADARPLVHHHART